MHRLRFAPSPTGSLHVGSARTALFNWLYARHYGGQMFLRIEDTDKARSTDDSTRAIFEGLTWLGLDWDGDVVHQGANLLRHQADATRLLDSGTAYRCFCSTDDLATQRAEAQSRGETFRYDGRCSRLSPAEIEGNLASATPFALRFRVPAGETAWTDVVHGPITFPNKDIGEGDFIILRSDGTPVYNLAVVSDDHAMGITLVMRGDDHISNTPKQILLFNALGAPLPEFAHLPMIHGPDGKKLSKRHGATAVGDYQHRGILPEAMVNFLSLLGWAPGGDVEVMSLDEMIALFSTEGLSRTAAIFDFTKLEWMNGQHLIRRPAEDLLASVKAALAELASAAPAVDTSALSDATLIRLIDLLKIRARTITQIAELAAPYLASRVDYDSKAAAKLWKDRTETARLLTVVRQKLEPIDSTRWNAATTESVLRPVADEQHISAGSLFQPLRLALTGSSASPGIFDVLEILGRGRSLQRIDDALAHLGQA